MSADYRITNASGRGLVAVCEAHRVGRPDVDEQQPAGGVLAGADVGARVVRGGAQRTAGFVLTNLLNAAGAVLLLRYLGVEDFGRFGTIIALLAIVQGVSDAGLSMTATRELALQDDPATRRALLAHVLGLRIALSAAGVACAVVFAAIAGYGHTLVLGTLIAGGGVFLVSVQGAMLLPLAIELRNGTITLNEVLRQAVLVAGFALLVVAGAGLLPFFAAPLVAGIVLVLATPALLSREHLVAPAWNTGELRSLAAIGLPIAIANVLGILYFRILVVLMSILSDSPREVGYYVASARVIDMLVGLPVLLIAVVIPVLTVAARDDPARLDYAAARLTEVMALGGIFFALVVGIAAEPIVRLLGGEAYRPAAHILQIQSVVLVTVFVTAAWSPTLLSMGRLRELAAATAVGLVAVLIAGCLLIPSLDAEGAAIAAVTADAVLCATMYVAVRRAGPGRALAGGRLARIVLAGGVALGVTVLGGLPPVAGAVVAAVVFAGLAAALGVVPGELRGGYAGRR